jgi:hypothetical protein
MMQCDILHWLSKLNQPLTRNFLIRETRYTRVAPKPS